VWVVVGLGNPGRRHVRSRHNVGFRVVDRLAERWGVSIEREAHRALLGEARRDGERILLVKPQTYMNASGDAVASVRRFHRVDLDHVVAVHDDVDLAVGRVRIRIGGRPGGNRGVASLIEVLGGEAFVRVKVGVGRPATGPVPPAYVLDAPAGAEAEALAAAEVRAAEAVELILGEGPAPAMNRMNQREAPHGGSPL
jgi:peptidyl-tRNA hydrolase, PTH1 family